MLIKMLLPLATDKNIKKAVAALQDFILSQQEKAGGKLVLSVEQSEDASTLIARLWLRGESNRLSLYKELDIYSITQQQIKTFVNGAK